MARFENKVILITGAGSGMGATEAAMMAKEGGCVLVADIAEENGKAVVEEIQKDGGKAEFISLNVTSLENWEAVAQQVRETYGRIDVLVNNAGVNSVTPVTAITEEELDRVFAINYKGAVFGIRALANLMRESGGGSIINIGSTVGIDGFIGVAYCSSKWAIRGLTKCCAQSFSEWGIRVNAIHPGAVETPMTKGTPLIAGMTHGCPMKRCGTMEEIASVVLFLASDESSFISGADIAVDGGFVELGSYGQMLDFVGLKDMVGLD